MEFCCTHCKNSQNQRCMYWSKVPGYHGITQVHTYTCGVHVYHMYHGTLLLYFTHTLVPVYRWYTCVHTYVCTYVKLHVPVCECAQLGTFFGFNFLLRGFKRVLCKYTFLNLPGLRSQIVHSNRLSN